jgi:FAD/FMN-containing dehydrogenase
MSGYGSWGRYPRCKHTVRPLSWTMDNLPLPTDNGFVLPYGQGRSYGDSCQNPDGTLLATARLNRFVSFDRQSGVLRCEAGVTLDEILRLVVPQGWFLPVTPGTRFVSVGGAIANDVHGKNHHRAGTFGRHVRALELLRSDGERRRCRADENAAWFAATIGGLGLTGLITWAELQLKPISGPYVSVDTIKFRDLAAFFDIAAESERDYEYTVAWVDCLARGPHLGRGLFMRGNHASMPAGRSPSSTRRRLRVPLDFPGFALNSATVRAFNGLYYRRQRRPRAHRIVHYEPFFYPLDAIANWNRIYGRRGFMQYQCVVPTVDDARAITALLRTIADSGLGSFLSVLKTFGDLPSPGMLSFPRPGVTLALDFPNRGARTLMLLERLDAIVRDAGGAVYPAKDARMSAHSFQTYYPNWEQFARYVDPRFSSGFWRRVTQPSKRNHHAKSADTGRDLRNRAGNRQAVCR